MPTSFNIILDDMLKLSSEVSLGAMKPIVAFMMFMVILLLPLKNVDRRDFITGLTFVLFMVFAGIMLTIVIPEHRGSRISPPYVVLSTVIVAMAALFKWTYQPTALPPPTRLMTKTPKQDSDE